MIAIAKRRSRATTHARFEAMLPAIRAYARRSFRSTNPELREELIAEVVANAFCAYQGLVERGKEQVAHPTPLAMYAIRQVRCGRRVGAKLNIRDVSSRHAQRAKGIMLGRLEKFDEATGEWREILVEDRRAGPAEIAAARIDVADWFRSLGRQKRRVAKLLASGETTGCAAVTYCPSSRSGTSYHHILTRLSPEAPAKVRPSQSKATA
ncbi:MAG TPA: hypothetical protein VHV55_28020 [Pirellulales bacterium]|jgi:hypothetical protein|nr:hypothetical protein [Pirellulales bacterium]